MSTKRVQTSTTGTRENAKTINTFFFPQYGKGHPKASLGFSMKSNQAKRGDTTWRIYYTSPRVYH